MILLNDKSVVVTGGSRGLGFGVVEALVDRGARVTVVARDRAALAKVEQRLGVAVMVADVTDEAAAKRTIAEIRPEILVLNAGATPHMGRLDQLTWNEFATNWETDVKASFFWLQAALNLPLSPGSRVLAVSSGAAELGSPLSGGYAGAKRTVWFMTEYADRVAKQKKLGVRFQVVVPRQIIGGTGVGDAGASAYAGAAGLDRETFLGGFGAPMPPRRFGDHVVSLLTDERYADGAAFGLNGSAGITIIERSEP
jgi:NAD(P)-dependent dehydrogenase (short-subunit alcohol dehydrogenase family)